MTTAIGANMNFLILFFSFLFGLEGVVCPMLEEIAKEFFSERLFQDYMETSTNGNYREAEDRAKKHADKIFKLKSIFESSALESFRLHNISHYLNTRTFKPKYLDTICIDLHGIPSCFVEYFALKSLKIVEKLRWQSETKEKYGKYEKVYFITGWGAHHAEGQGGAFNKMNVKKALKRKKYEMDENIKNEGMISVILGHDLKQYEPPFTPRQGIVGLPEEWKNQDKKIKNQKKIGRTSSLPAYVYLDQASGNTGTGISKSSTLPQLANLPEIEGDWQLYDPNMWNKSFDESQLRNLTQNPTQNPIKNPAKTSDDGFTLVEERSRREKKVGIQ